MTAIGDSIRAVALSLQTIADAVDAIPVGVPTDPTIPTGIDCLAGTWPTGANYPAFPLSLYSNDTQPTSVELGYYDRLMAHCPDGTIGIWGDSTVQDMVDGKISQFVQTFGVGGESLRRCINRMARGGLVHRAGTVVFASGINELSNFTGYAPYSASVITDNVAYLHSGLAAQATGKWVIRDILPVDEPLLCANVSANYSGMNAKIDMANQKVRNVWTTSPAQVQFVGLKEQLVDSTGNLAAANHIDGMHLSRAGDDIQCAGIKAALQALGVI
ncbi:hypothetical protein FHT87_005145 [Rhizobium sp. BK316]|uniref:hypothetical protein n=1 Tax=Rhizobium sp. BK316 TaxID=2587053 RepID=UPI00160CF805|nr:hypothetical protein [Rhizobium sp. BK316]MBB3411192.1 hypothetical protein [Rhizobium sp. BK316]